MKVKLIDEFVDKDDHSVDDLPKKLWAAWFWPSSAHKKPQRVTLNSDSMLTYSSPPQWWHKNGNESVLGVGLHRHTSKHHDYPYGPVMFAAESKAEVQNMIDFAEALFDITKQQLGIYDDK